MYKEQTESLSENQDRNLDFFGFEYVENQRKVHTENSKEIFGKIERERAMEKENEDLLFHDTILFQ